MLSIMVQSLLCRNLPEGAFNMLGLHSPVKMFLSTRKAGCCNYKQQRPNLFLQSSLKSVKSVEDTSL